MLCSWTMFAHPLHIACCLCLHCSFIHKIHTYTQMHSYSLAHNFLWKTLSQPYTLSAAHTYALFIDFVCVYAALLLSTELLIYYFCVCLYLIFFFAFQGYTRPNCERHRYTLVRHIGIETIRHGILHGPSTAADCLSMCGALWRICVDYHLLGVCPEATTVATVSVSGYGSVSLCPCVFLSLSLSPCVLQYCCMILIVLHRHIYTPTYTAHNQRHTHCHRDDNILRK